MAGKMEITFWGDRFYIRRPWSGNIYDPKMRKKYRRTGFPPFEYFAGYDFMGSAEWEADNYLESCAMDKESAISTKRDLEAAEEDELDRKVNEFVNDPETWESLKRFMESIGCTNVTIIKEG